MADEEKIDGYFPRLPANGLIAFVITAICAKWVPVSARLHCVTADKDVNAGKRKKERQRAEGKRQKERIKSSKFKKFKVGLNVLSTKGAGSNSPG